MEKIWRLPRKNIWKDGEIKFLFIGLRKIIDFISFELRLEENSMSVQEFRKKVYEAWENEKKETEHLIKELLAELPDRDADNPDVCLEWPQEGGWSAMVEDVLEDSGYSITYLDGKYIIEFSEEVIEEINEELIEEAKMQRDLKRQRK